MLPVLDDMRELLRSKGSAGTLTAPTTRFKPGREIVFIGIRLDRGRVLRLLRSVLLAHAEFADGEDQWRRYPDPLPAWELAHTH